ncbi:MAG TPA: SIS domain-containing protein [Actinomycetes bacterium]|nr:SIS domain-containing protein [Actinomycetes bacterium]
MADARWQALVAERVGEFGRVAAAVADEDLQRAVIQVGELLVRTYAGGGQTLFAGNGGSAAQAQHAAAEFVGRCTRDRRPLPSIALTEPTVVTALANDYGYEQVFARQVAAYGRPGDALVVLSTSGRSGNVLRALQEGRARGLATVALTGGDGGDLLGAADHVLLAPSSRTGAVQEVHALWCHVWAEMVEVALEA